MTTTHRFVLRTLVILCLLFTTGCTVLELLDSLPTDIPPAQSAYPADIHPADTNLVEVDTPAPQTSPATPTPAGGDWPGVPPSSGDFDYYVLALSWAPEYCSANPGDTQECALGKKYAFVLHGLWPQFTKGYPSNCSSAPLPAALQEEYADLYANTKLFTHEWSKHGTCSGLSPAEYLALTSQIKSQVQIPADYRAPASPFRTTTDDLVAAFRDVNPALTETSLAVNGTGSGRYLSEVYICISKAGQPTACGADVRKSARKSLPNPDFLVRSVR